MRAAALAVAALGLAVLVTAGTRLLQRAQGTGCEQTYSYPSYVDVPLLDDAWTGHRYRLRLYREAAGSRAPQGVCVGGGGVLHCATSRWCHMAGQS